MLRKDKSIAKFSISTKAQNPIKILGSFVF